MSSYPITRIDGLTLYAVLFVDRHWRKSWSTVVWASSESRAIEVARANLTRPKWATQGMAGVLTEADVRQLFVGVVDSD